MPDELLEPAGSVAAFASVVERLDPGARVLDCAAGTGQLAVGLALRGFDVAATDASPAMIERTRALAARNGVDVHAEACAWEDLAPDGAFDAVFCVGNSLTHAADRRAALAAMARVLRPGGLLVITSRNWEHLRATRPGLEIADHLTERGGRRGLVIHAWTIPDAWDAPHHLDVAVAVLGDSVTTHRERLRFWPFTNRQLDADLRAAGLIPETTTYAPGVERYLVTATSPGG